jgi:hypothetical protein
MDEASSFRFVMVRKNLIFETENVIERSPWCTSISFCRQQAEIKKVDYQNETQLEEAPPVENLGGKSIKNLVTFYTFSVKKKCYKIKSFLIFRLRE